MSTRFAWLVVSGALLLGLPDTAHAGDPLPGRLPGLRLPPRMQRTQGKLQVGAWVEYSLYKPRLRRRVRLRWAIVGKVGKSYWWELTFREARKPTLRIKALIRGKVNKPSRVKRVIVQAGRQQALELPLKKGQKMMSLYLPKRSVGKVKHHGSERVRVAAGTFLADHMSWKDAHGQTYHEWSAKSAGIWGLVKFRSPTLRMELIKQGRGARSGIRGIPAKWHLPGR